MQIARENARFAEIEPAFPAVFDDFGDVAQFSASGGAHALSQTFDGERFADNSLVVGDPRIRFYAGYALVLTDSNCMGTLCLLDTGRVARPVRISNEYLTMILPTLHRGNSAQLERAHHEFVDAVVELPPRNPT
jgi:GAF domain-containing protein